ncbi:hypothetical protein HYQ46_011056 [Verticillium longisporum]|nr:hypothetical protein HYQ46_011056 [Verticillium longisporum]
MLDVPGLVDCKAAYGLTRGGATSPTGWLHSRRRCRGLVVIVVQETFVVTAKECGGINWLRVASVVVEQEFFIIVSGKCLLPFGSQVLGSGLARVVLCSQGLRRCRLMLILLGHPFQRIRSRHVGDVSSWPASCTLLKKSSSAEASLSKKEAEAAVSVCSGARGMRGRPSSNREPTSSSSAPVMSRPTYCACSE